MITILQPENSNAGENPEFSDSLKSKPELLDEIRRLRRNLVEMQADSRAEKERSRTLTGAINVGYWEWDETTKRAAYFSKEMAGIMGMSLESLYETYQREEDFYPLVHPDDLNHYVNNLSVVLTPDHPDGLAQTFDYRIVRPDGEVRYVRELEYGKLEHDGVVTRTYRAIQDITDHHESTRALTESEQRYSSLFSKLPLGVMEQDWSSIKKAVDKLQSEGVENLEEYFANNPLMFRELAETIAITSVNEALLRIYGADSAEEFIEGEEGREDWWDEEWANLYASEIAALAGPNRINYAELTETRMDGSVFGTRLITSIVKGDEDTWKRILTIVEDVSERKQNELDLIAAKELAEQASEAKSQFLANMSHEIRTPINGVMGMTELLLQTPLNGRQRHFAETIDRSNETLLTLINDILDVSKIEAGKLEIQSVPFDVRETVEDVITMLAEHAHEKGIELTGHVPALLQTRFLGDATRVHQVVMNLTNNALKFTHHGEVNVRVTVIEETSDSQSLLFEVKDTGIGIEAAAQTRIFDSFSQADGSTTRNFGGTGLGLTISSTLVELMGGEIGVDSTLGVGSTFWFRLCLQKAEPLAEEMCNSERALEGTRVLIVDDNATNQEILLEQVTGWGARADVAGNGMEALALFGEQQSSEKPYQIVLLDNHMPGMDGIEVAQAIQENMVGAAAKIVMLSSVSDDLGANTLAGLGINTYLTKPVRQAELRKCLLSLMSCDSAASPSGRVEPLKRSNENPLSGIVLVAEDNPVNQEVTCLMLEFIGLQSVVVENGHEALEAMSHNSFDVVLMDCQMPTMDGFEATAAIRQLKTETGKGKRVPIVALTANSLEGDREICLESGMDDYLSKPFREAELREVLERWLPCTTQDKSAAV